MDEDIYDLDDPTGELKAEINRQLLDLLARDPEAFELLARNVPGNLSLWLQDTPLTKGQADELRNFILSLKPRACLIQPDMVEVFGVDDKMTEQIIAKLRALGVGRVMPTAPDPPPPPKREEKLPPPEDSPEPIKLPGAPQPPIVPDEDEPQEQKGS